MTLFLDRQDAGRQLARAVVEQVARLPDRVPDLVLALPRGGVPLAAEVARALGAELDVLSRDERKSSWLADAQTPDVAPLRLNLEDGRRSSTGQFPILLTSYSCLLFRTAAQRNAALGRTEVSVRGFRGTLKGATCKAFFVPG